jgi:hypothetical protein
MGTNATQNNSQHVVKILPISLVLRFTVTRSVRRYAEECSHILLTPKVQGLVRNRDLASAQTCFQLGTGEVRLHGLRYRHSPVIVTLSLFDVTNVKVCRYHDTVLDYELCLLIIQVSVSHQPLRGAIILHVTPC